MESFGIGHVFKEGHVYPTAQVFDSLRELDQFYDDLDKGEHNETPFLGPRFPPLYATYADRVSNATVNSECLESFTSWNKSAFLVKIKGSKEKAVAICCAEASMAPRLLFCGLGLLDLRNGAMENECQGCLRLAAMSAATTVMVYAYCTHLEVLSDPTGSG